MAIKQFRNWFFQATGTPGTRFLKNNKPTENVFKDFLASIGFFKEVSDTASTSQQGFVKKATNAQIASRSAADTDGFTLGVTPAQLPKVTLNGAPITATQDVSGAQTYNVTTPTPATPTTVSQNNTPITPVLGNYNVNTVLESIIIAKSSYDTLLVNHNSAFTIPTSTLLSNNCTLYTQYNTLTGSAFTYNATTGIITINKHGLYNMESWIHFGSSPEYANQWIKYTKEVEGFEYRPGYFYGGILIASGPSIGNAFALDQCVFYAGNSFNTSEPLGEPYNPQQYVDLLMSNPMVELNVGDEFFIRIQNNTAYEYPATGPYSGGTFRLHVELLKEL